MYYTKVKQKKVIDYMLNGYHLGGHDQIFLWVTFLLLETPQALTPQIIKVVMSQSWISW